MAVPPAVRPFLRVSTPLLAALAALLLLAPPASAGAQGRSSGAQAAKTRLGLSPARQASPSAGHCGAALARRREESRRSWRKRRARRVRLCRRALQRRAQDSRFPPQPLYWGASIGDHLTGTQAPWDMEATARYEAMAGKRLSLLHFFAPFSNCASSCWYYDFPTGPMQTIREHGAIPVLSWSSQSIPSTLDEPDYQLSDVVSGRHDAFIREFAEAARDWGQPFFLRFNWEMNGNWFPWSEQVNGNRPGEYAAAWRHVHEIFAAAGARNATWVWCPNVDPEGRWQDIGPLYPGDEYVDWTCLDGYNWGTSPGAPRERMSFAGLFASTYERITGSIAPGKPMLIGEVGASERGGAKADWIADTLATVPTDYPKIRGLVWFERYDDGMDWPLESSAAATSAFATGIQNASYLPNQYGGLAASPIPPPA